MPGLRQLVDPMTLHFTQRTAGGNQRAGKIRASMQRQGFIEEPHNPVNVVRTGIGLTTLDNTRVALAQELGIEQIPVIVHEYDEPLPEVMIRIRRFGDARTWGEAVRYRTSQQRPEPLPPDGTPERPQLPD